MKTHPLLYLMILPVLAYFLIYHYYPMYGLSIAFYDYVPVKGIKGSDFVGLEHFRSFISDPYFFRTMRNTLLINLWLLLFGFPIPILFAILLNELNSPKLRKITQTVTYMPHFISTVVICGLMLDFCSEHGVITTIICSLTGMKPVNLFSKSAFFQPLYVAMCIWQEFGWDSIIYYAALTGIDQELYEAAEIDGAGRYQIFRRITLPLLKPFLGISITQAFIAGMNIFDEIVALNGFNDIGKNLSMESYLTTFSFLNFGKGSAITYVIMLLTAILGVFYLKSRTMEVG